MQVSPTRAEMMELTAAWDGERFEDGRPRVPDDVLDSLRDATVEQVWHVLTDNGYSPQFAGGWQQTRPGQTLVGRCVTAQFLPLRPDLDAVVKAAGARAGFTPEAQQNTWVVDSLQEGDVFVADIFGKVREGTVVGDNLGGAVAMRTGVGAVIDGGVRDLAGLVRLPEPVNFFYRGTDPTPIEEVSLAGMNIPVRIGAVTVLPGDVALGTLAGVAFIPAHLAAEVAERSSDIRMRDVFSKQRLAERRYTTAEIDVSVWPESIEDDYRAWRVPDAG
jgi:regulator of RNase E activity RraA